MKMPLFSRAFGIAAILVMAASCGGDDESLSYQTRNVYEQLPARQVLFPTRPTTRRMLQRCSLPPVSMLF